jgi:triosephosphate isomerase
VDGELVVAYEPIWAIGTGKVATPADIGEMHGAIRAALVERYGDLGERIRILYGGSVKPDNAAAIFAVADVDGALVGGASLTAAQFVPIIGAAAAS